MYLWVKIMVVIVHNDNYLDLEMPVYMTEKQLHKFIHLLQKLFGDVEVIEVEEPPGQKFKAGEMRKWSVDELALLFSSLGEEEIAERTNRSVMSVVMKIGSFKPEFYCWASKTKKVVDENNLRYLIREFLTYKEGGK